MLEAEEVWEQEESLEEPSDRSKCLIDTQFLPCVLFEGRRSQARDSILSTLHLGSLESFPRVIHRRAVSLLMAGSLSPRITILVLP